MTFWSGVILGWIAGIISTLIAIAFGVVAQGREDNLAEYTDYVGRDGGRS